MISSVRTYTLDIYIILCFNPQVKMFLVVALAYIIFWGPLFTVSFYNLSINVRIFILILILNLLVTAVQVHGEFFWAQDLNPGQCICRVEDNWAIF